MLFLITAVLSSGAIWRLYVIHRPTMLWPSDRRQKNLPILALPVEMTCLLPLRSAPVLSKRLHQGSLLYVSLQVTFLFQQVSNKAKNPSPSLLHHGLHYFLAQQDLLKISPKTRWGVLLRLKKLKASVKALGETKDWSSPDTRQLLLQTGKTSVSLHNISAFCAPR